MMGAPLVYAAINAVTREGAERGVAKNRTNLADDYQYRSVDDILNFLAPLLAKHRLCVLPRMLHREMIDRRGNDGLLVSVSVRCTFSLISAEDGSSHIVEAYGEALDTGDKATAKASSAAYKTAMIQTFCIPTIGAEESVPINHKLWLNSHVPEPVQGWDQWQRDIADIIEVCESEQALATVQDRNRDLLKAMSREKPALYEELGRSFTTRRESLRCRVRSEAQGSGPRSRRVKSRASSECSDA